MKKIYIGSSWKMNLTQKDTEAYFKELLGLLEEDENRTIFVAVPFPYLWKARELTMETSVLIGAQNMHWEKNGPFTGEISPQMLVDLGVQFVELGHSERRHQFNETDFNVNKKVNAALAHSLIPLVCVGETLEEKEFGVAKETVARQIKIALHNACPSITRPIWIAYEPVWAIGEGSIPASPSYMAEMHQWIKHTLDSLYPPETAQNIPVLYGGSVNRANCTSFFRNDSCDGLFIGRAGWTASTFVEIVNIVSQFLAI